MYIKEIKDYAEKMQRIEDKDPNYMENEKWQYYRRQQDLMYLANAKSEIAELQNRVQHYNNRIAQLQEYVEKHKHIINEDENVKENQRDS